MGKYIFQTGGEDYGASLVNAYLDQLMNSQQQEEVQEPDIYETVEEESDYITQLREYDKDQEAIMQQENMDNRFSRLEALLTSKLSEIEERQMEIDAISSFNSEDYFSSLYDTQNDFVQYNAYSPSNTKPDYTPPANFTRDRIQRIIDKYSNGKAPLNADDFIEISNKYGVPVDLMLAQAIQESNIGTKGMAVRTKNIFNVGNNGNTGKTEYQNSFKTGLDRYARLIKTEYATDPNNVTTQDIIKNRFVRPRKGGQYAEDDYTDRVYSVLKQLENIK